MLFGIKLTTSVLENLMPNIWTVLTQLLATLILFLVLKKLVWKPVKETLEKRSVYEQERLEKAERLRKENEELNTQVQEELRQANIKANEIVKKAQLEGEKVRDNLIAEGKEKAQVIVSDAQRSIELQKAKMVDEMHQEIVDVAISAAEKMLQHKLDDENDRKLIDKFVKEVSK